MLQDLIQKNPRTDFLEVVKLNKKTLFRDQDTGHAKITEIEEKKQCSSDICAAGTKCKISIGAIATSTHRCPGPFQDFSFCKKPIHAICGVAIPHDKIKKDTNNSGMHTKWSFNCALKVENLCGQPKQLGLRLNPKNPYNLTNRNLQQTKSTFHSRPAASPDTKQSDMNLPSLSTNHYLTISGTKNDCKPTTTYFKGKISIFQNKYDFI